MRPKLVRIFNEEALICLLSGDPESATMQLADRIKQDYARLFDQSLHISNDSLAVEIWAHVYAERLSHALFGGCKWKLTDKLDRFIKSRCEVIDCGEAAIDNNRRIWDLLARRKRWMAKLLKKRL